MYMYSSEVIRVCGEGIFSKYDWSTVVHMITQQKKGNHVGWIKGLHVTFGDTAYLGVKVPIHTCIVFRRWGDRPTERVIITVGIGWVLLASAASRFSGCTELAYCSFAKGGGLYSTRACVTNIRITDKKHLLQCLQGPSIMYE